MQLTFLNITNEITADAVKSAAMIIIIMPTGILLLRPVRDEIHPLKEKERTNFTRTAHKPFNHRYLRGALYLPGSDQLSIFLKEK